MQDRRPEAHALAIGLIAATSQTGCAPTVNVIGVYFPAWLVSAVAGVVIAYVAVSILARKASTRGLAQSGLLFCSLTLGVGLSVWWIFFSRF